MRQLRRTVLLGLVALLAAGGAVAQVDFSKYVALGDSLTAGYASAGLAKTYQDFSYPAILAGQFGLTGFQQPIVSDPGIPAVLELKQLKITSQGVSPVLLPKAGNGQPTNATLAGPYNNLGIPGANTNDLLTKTGDITKLLTGKIDPKTIMYDIVLRDGKNQAFKQAIGAKPTFLTVWIGNNDVLGAAITGIALDGVTLTKTADFQTQYTTLLGALRTSLPNTGIIVGTIPDVGAIPFVTTIKPYLINPADGSHIPLIGEAGFLKETDFLTLNASALLAQGIGIPVPAGGKGTPLPEGSIDALGLHAGVILRADEVAAIRARTAELNAVIKTVAASTSAKVIDFNAIFADIVAHGRVIGGVKLSAGFLTGGIFSYDGVHPQSLGYALLSNEWIGAINAAYGAKVPLVDLSKFLLPPAAASATSVQAAETIFSTEAGVQLIKTFAPYALTDRIESYSHPVRRHITPVERPERPGIPGSR